jgi:L-fuconolactonase
MRIDAHQHFWIYNERDYGWISDKLSKIKRNFEPADLHEILENHGFDGSIAVQARQSIEETEWLLELADKNDFIKGVVGWVDLRSNNLESHLQKYSQNKKFVGVRHVLQDEPDDQFVLEEDFLDGISMLSKYDLTYDILVFERQLPASIKMVEKFPDQKFVVDHIAKPQIKKGLIDPWKENINAIASFNNVHCKLSGMITEADWVNWSEADFTKYLDVVYESFGPDRLMFGSDWPVCNLAGSYENVLNLVKHYISDLSENSRRSILGENALNFYLG